MNAFTVQQLEKPKNVPTQQTLCNVEIQFMMQASSSWLEDEGVGFQPTDMEMKGKCPMSTLADALWVIDRHSKHLQTEATLFLPSSLVSLVIKFLKLASTSWSALLLKSMHANYLSC